jgi:CRP-like cAMP-binding protein
VNELWPFSPEEVDAAVAASSLSGLGASLVGEILAGAVRSEAPRGRRFDGPPLRLLLAGLIRVALAAADGRRYVVAYLRPGTLVGLAHLTGRRYPLIFEAVTDCRLLRLDAAAFDELRRRRPEVGVAVADQLNRHIDDILHETTLCAFGHVRQRVLRHLLALAAIDSATGATCAITHQELADAVGAARETVARIMSELRGEGLVTGDHGTLTLPDVARLRGELTS